MDKTLFEQLTAGAERRSYDPGATIIRQGSRADAFFVVISGTVDVTRRLESGATVQVSSMTTPSFFGEIGLMEEGRRTATVRAGAESPVEAFVIPRANFKEFVDASEMMVDEIAAMMQKHRIKDSLSTAFGSAPQELLDEVAAQAKVVTFTQGDKIICQGDPAEYFYILTHGRVEVLHRQEDGRTYLINFHGPGEYFGEIGILQNRKRSATVRAADDKVEVLAFDRTAFQNVLGDSVATESAIAQRMAERLARHARNRDQ